MKIALFLDVGEQDDPSQLIATTTPSKKPLAGRTRYRVIASVPDEVFLPTNGAEETVPSQTRKDNPK